MKKQFISPVMSVIVLDDADILTESIDMEGWNTNSSNGGSGSSGVSLPFFSMK